MTELPGRALAQELITRSREECLRTPMDAVIQAAQAGSLSPDQQFRLLGRLWTLERMFYYVYGGWGQGLELNDFPPSVKYLFARQIYDDSTHEMLYLDTILRRGWVATQREVFEHPYGRFEMDSALAFYVFSLRNFATYPHTIRIAALNLGPKVLELHWMQSLAEKLPDGELREVLASQLVENRSHVNMGRRIVEEHVSRAVDADLCRWARTVVTQDYGRYLQEVSDLVLGRTTAPMPVTTAPVTD